MPVSPNTPLDIANNFKVASIMKEYGMIMPTTATDEITPFFRSVQIEQDFAYCVFASQPIINEIDMLPEDSRHFYMDGTFKVVPYGNFNQLLIIYAEFFQKVGSSSMHMNYNRN